MPAPQLPNEILDIIIGGGFIKSLARHLDPDSDDSEMNESKYDLKHWHTCSLVCRQWRAITLPYLFNRLRLGLTKDKSSVPHAVQFLPTVPWVANCIQHVSLERLQLDIASLDSLLRCLPNIRTVVLERLIFVKGDDIDRPRFFSNYTVDLLSYKLCRSFSTLLAARMFYDEVLDLLALFSDIGKLVLPGKLFEGPDVVQAARLKLDSVIAIRNPHEWPQVRSLDSSLNSFIPPFLTGFGLVRHLTDVRLQITDLSVNVLDGLADLLHSAGPVLRRFDLDMERCFWWFDVIDSSNNSESHLLVYVAIMSSLQSAPERTLFIDRLRRGFAACSALESIQLSAVFCGHSSDDITFLKSEWITVTAILSFLPAQVQSILLHIGFDKYMEQGILHRLPWLDLRNSCKQFESLRELMIDIIFFDLYPRSASCPIPCVSYEMRVFKEILVLPQRCPAVYHSCQHAECQEYNAELNRLVPVEGVQRQLVES